MYYNGSQLTDKEDVAKIVFRREPVNIGMERLYDATKLYDTVGYVESVYNDTSEKTWEARLFRDLPHTASIYSETYLWPEPGKEKKIEIACLSVPAPALDTKDQPHWNYYVSKDGWLDKKKYSDEMDHLANTIVKAALDHKTTIKRLVIPKYGQGAFLFGLKEEERQVASSAFYTSLLMALIKNKEPLKGIDIVMSTYDKSGVEDIQQNFVDKLKKNGIDSSIIVGDILKTTQEGDLIVNAWDPHSAPGNGCDGDKSFDGAMGKGTGIPLTQSAWHNTTLFDKQTYISL